MRKAILVAMLLAAAPAWAQHLVDGEIRKIDRSAKTVTIKHGPIPSIDMPPMTMVFEVKDPAMLVKLKPGDMVHFQAEILSGGRTVVTKMEKAR